MTLLRELQFENLDAAVEDARTLLASGYAPQGNWSLGQICRHLILVQDVSVDGYPTWMSRFTLLRTQMRRWWLPKLIGGNSRRTRSPSIAVPSQ
jgi:hypothetical protein